MIGRIFWSIIAILFPWLILFLDDNPGGALIAFLMQATVIGWIPASIWAYRVSKQSTTMANKPKQSSTATKPTPKPKTTSKSLEK